MIKVPGEDTGGTYFGLCISTVMCSHAAAVGLGQACWSHR